ncbi:hypothetical protein CAOG_04224 [Capsaspora owczarzaki ATCC 30864]|uniref:hypothetical protein n=1 Tax=Capsaspora owczarzaki (strain ATCC 30864) TaxID=595528 RepID=UPI0003520676|nr:hypothetical protein CAOG_04224 [Capsaspora owczarzaki ATCC 30864]|eukprot:XP_004348049.2 hypothetical protein CAOG_04224 [Capsaspora owczarzaki ATCC 30864]
MAQPPPVQPQPASPSTHPNELSTTTQGSLSALHQSQSQSQAHSESPAPSSSASSSTHHRSLSTGSSSISFLSSSIANLITSSATAITKTIAKHRRSPSAADSSTSASPSPSFTASDNHASSNIGATSRSAGSPNISSDSNTVLHDAKASAGAAAAAATTRPLSSQYEDGGAPPAAMARVSPPLNAAAALPAPAAPAPAAAPLLLVKPSSSGPARTLFQGTLHKWTNYITNWQSRFVVITGEPEWTLSYYMNENQQADGAAVRSFLPLGDVVITVAADSDTDFSVYNKSEAYYLRAPSKEERKQWVVALGSAKSQQAMALARLAESTEIDERNRRTEQLNRLIAASRHHEEAIRKQLVNVQTAVSTLVLEAKEAENGTGAGSGAVVVVPAVADKRKSTRELLVERAMVLRATLRTTMDNLAESIDLVNEQEEIWERSVEYERRQQLKAEQSLRAIRSQQEALEKLLERAQAEGS